MKKSIKALVGIAAAASVIALAGCSGGTDGGGSTDITNEQAVMAGQAILAHQQPIDTWEAPGPAFDASSVAGKTIYFVVPSMQIPIFPIVEAGLKASFGLVGAQVTTCDTNHADPAALATCLQQAIDAGAGAVVVGSLPYVMAPNAFDAVTAAGIPVVMGMLGTEPNPQAGDSAALSDLTKYAFASPNYIEMAAWNAMAVIYKSNAKANVLVVEATDTPDTAAWMEYGAIPTYAEMCPDCKVTVVKTTTGELDKLPSLVSAKLVADPKIDYIQSDFDSLTQPILQGIQSAGSTNVHVVSMDGQLDVLQGMKANGTVVADTGYNLFAQAWYMADQAMRMMTGGQAIENETFPFRRMFTPENVVDLDLTAAGQESGLWYGKADYMGGFAQLWGAAAK